jgi:starvation-inducible DNA-binding protein
MSRNEIGLEIKDSKVLVKKLNGLLANYQVYYQNLRNFHWNVSGPNFFELHVKFEEFYNAANLAIDELAERILTLGERPLSSYSEYIQASKITEAQMVLEPKRMVEIIKENITTLLDLEREVLGIAGENGDEGTDSLMSDYITQKEKVVWMLSAYLK